MRRLGKASRRATSIRWLGTLLLCLVCFGCFGASSASAAQPPVRGALYTDGQSDRYLLGGDWLYRADPTGSGIAAGWQNPGPATGWAPTTVPNAFNAGDFSVASMVGSVGWYRRDFTIPARAFARYVPGWARSWMVRFESVNYRATVWLNGRRLGTHTGAYLPFELALAGLRPGVNSLVVRVDNRRGPRDVPPGPIGGWWNYGGLLREVYLRPVQRADLNQVTVRPVLPCPHCAATIQANAVVRNLTSRRQTVSLRATFGGRKMNLGRAVLRPHATWRPATSVRIAHPKLWSIDRPYLYRFTATLSDQRGRRLSRYVVLSGVRKIAVVGGRLTLNGRQLSLRGVDMHEQNLLTGAALNAGQVDTLTGWVRALGAHLIRSHYPLNPRILETADRDGILVWSEVPLWRPTIGELQDQLVVRRAQDMLRQNISVNQNHPSVLLWSVGNELPTPAPGPEVNYIRSAAALVHKLDPTRPAAMAVTDWPGAGCQSGYAPLDIVGFNEYFGWFDVANGGTADRDQLSPFLDTFRACYPNKALFVSEFGFDANRNGPVEERGTYAFQANSLAYHLGVFASKPWLSGTLLWLLQDFTAWPGWAGGNPLGQPPFVTKGLYDLNGAPKPAAAVVSSIFHGTRQIRAGTVGRAASGGPAR